MILYENMVVTLLPLKITDPAPILRPYSDTRLFFFQLLLSTSGSAFRDLFQTICLFALILFLFGYRIFLIIFYW